MIARPEELPEGSDIRNVTRPTWPEEAGFDIREILRTSEVNSSAHAVLSKIADLGVAGAEPQEKLARRIRAAVQSEEMNPDVVNQLERLCGELENTLEGFTSPETLKLVAEHPLSQEAIDSTLAIIEGDGPDSAAREG